MVGFVEADEQRQLEIEEWKQSVLRVLRTYPDDQTVGMTWLQVCAALGRQACARTLMVLRLLVNDGRVASWGGGGKGPIKYAAL